MVANIRSTNLIYNIVFVNFSSGKIRSDINECGQTARCDAFQSL